jgi:hypothetical protein
VTEQRRCPVCDQPVPLGFGRPRIYCSTECRREAYRRCHELDDLVEQLAEARSKLASGYAPGADFWQGMAHILERQITELRALIPEALLP